MARTLYIVPTPIGNLEDITLRALRVLREAALIAAEDTRTTHILLQHYQITTPLTSYHEHNKLTKLERLFDTLESADVALVSDAGTPGISDPGYELIGAAIARGFRVEPLPGASALITGLVASGLPTDGFVYLGFLPRKEKALEALLQSLAGEQRTLVAYESPNRLIDTLGAISKVLGERTVCVARELTKKFEEFTRGSTSEVLAYYTETPPRGEIVLIVRGAEEAAEWDEAQVQGALHTQLTQGVSLRQAAREIASQSGWNKREVYALGMALKPTAEDDGEADDPG